MPTVHATDSDRHDESPLSDRWLLGLIAGGLLVRIVAAALLDPDMRLRGDENIYTRHALELLETGRLDTGWFVRPPLYFVFMAGTHLLSDALPVSWTLLTKWLQCIASVATAIPVYRGARRIAGTRAARFAAAFLLFDPTLIGYTSLLWPETLFTLLVAIVFDGVADLDPAWFDGAERVGITAGASTPEFLVKELVDTLRKRGIREVRESEGPDENVVFQLPGELVAGEIGRVSEQD
ncbi:MAG: hypothetical protein AAEJ52_04195 [Myxococcota bacterium]